MNWLILGMGFTLGAILGSLVKALADRSIDSVGFFGRSYCPRCKRTLGWYDLLPIFSYLILKGRCRSCKKPIPLSYFLVEVVMGAAIALVFLSTLGDLSNLSEITILLDLFFKCFVAVILGIIFLVDLEVGLIPDRITYPATLITLIYLILFSTVQLWGRADFWLVAGTQIGLAVSVAVLSAASFVFLIILTKGKGMGWGDVKYMVFLGLVLSFPNILAAIFLAFFIGAIFSLGLILSRKRHFGQTIPFGPFLSIGGYIALLWGAQIIDYYLQKF